MRSNLVFLGTQNLLKTLNAVLHLYIFVQLLANLREPLSRYQANLPKFRTLLKSEPSLPYPIVLQKYIQSAI